MLLFWFFMAGRTWNLNCNEKSKTLHKKEQPSDPHLSVVNSGWHSTSYETNDNKRLFKKQYALNRLRTLFIISNKIRSQVSEDKKRAFAKRTKYKYGYLTHILHQLRWR